MIIILFLLAIIRVACFYFIKKLPLPYLSCIHLIHKVIKLLKNVFICSCVGMYNFQYIYGSKYFFLITIFTFVL